MKEDSNKFDKEQIELKARQISNHYLDSTSPYKAIMKMMKWIEEGCPEVVEKVDSSIVCEHCNYYIHHWPPDKSFVCPGCGRS